ncbi:unnamed protein product [Sphacelaria rigidula]
MLTPKSGDGLARSLLLSPTNNETSSSVFQSSVLSAHDEGESVSIQPHESLIQPRPSPEPTIAVPPHSMQREDSQIIVSGGSDSEEKFGKAEIFGPGKEREPTPVSPRSEAVRGVKTETTGRGSREEKDQGQQHQQHQQHTRFPHSVSGCVSLSNFVSVSSSSSRRIYPGHDEDDDDDDDDDDSSALDDDGNNSGSPSEYESGGDGDDDGKGNSGCDAGSLGETGDRLPGGSSIDNEKNERKLSREAESETDRSITRPPQAQLPSPMNVYEVHLAQRSMGPVGQR